MSQGGRGYIRADQERFAWMMVSPAMLVIFIVGTAPLLALLIMSGYRINLAGFRPNGWVGLDNFQTLLSDGRFWGSMRVMAIYTVTSVVAQIVIGLGLALALMRQTRGQALLRLTILLPMILAPVVIGLSWRTLILTQNYGILDAISQALGLGSHPWLTHPTWALVSVIVIHTWQWTPFAFLVFTATLHAMSPDPFEAAKIDGASSWQIFRDLTIPMMGPTIAVVVILRTVIAMRAFEAIYAATGGGPGVATETLNLYAYRVSFTSLRLGEGAALGAVLLAITLMVTYLIYRLQGESAAT